MVQGWLLFFVYVPWNMWLLRNAVSMSVMGVSISSGLSLSLRSVRILSSIELHEDSAIQ
jgi:hypothetical protein